ncbi:O-antigen ligase family protein [Acinetobacter haemolyticus]|nr:O-antigen ligase family protein [Acinetobacter haemolyticus]
MTSFLSVSIESLFIFINYFFAGIFLLFSAPFFIKNKIFNYDFFKILSFYYISALMSVFLGFIYLYIFEDWRLNFFDISMYGRIFNVVLFSVLSWVIVSLCNYRGYLKVRDVVIFYSIGCAILILTGYWQSLSLYWGIGSFPFETRSWVHGFNKGDYDIEARLTGIAAEPSYFVPFVLDFLILSLIAFKSKSIKITAFIFGACVMILSFSPSGYACTLIAFSLAAILVSKPNIKTFKYLSAFLVVVFVVMVMLLDKVKNVGYVVERLTNLSQDGRFRSIYDTLMVFFDSSFINLMFGYGITNFKVASQYTNYSFLQTSNNLFADVLVEMGFVGLFLMSLLFFNLFIRIFLSARNNYQKFIAYALLFDLIATSMIRADYSTSRFFIMICLIFLLSKYDVYKRAENI